MDAAVEALRIEWSGFAFRVKGTPERREHSFKFELSALYQQRDWSTFEIELVFGEVSAAEQVAPYDLSAFGLMLPDDIPCMTAAEQIAQKLHAVSDPHENRPRDLIDIHLLDSRLHPDDEELRDHCMRTFHARGTHTWPPNIALRGGWERELRHMIDAIDPSLSVNQVVGTVQMLVARLMGVAMPRNVQYHFLVLSAHQQIPNIMQRALVSDDALDVFDRMTQREGWRLAQIVPYPSRDQSRAILAVLEKPMVDEDSQ